MTNDERQPQLPTLQTEQLTKSYRFDEEMASLLTAFQYQADGITLTAKNDRPLPAEAVDATTAGIKTVLNSEGSLVFVCYGHRDYQMVNPVEAELIAALTEAINLPQPAPCSGGRATEPLGEGADTAASQSAGPAESTDALAPSVGVVTPHNAQRGRLTAVLSDDITADTVEKYQGGERDIMAVSATVSDPEFARGEEQFILNPRRLLVAISRAKRLTIVVCSETLFEVAPKDSDHLHRGPIWARLFTEAVGRDPQPAWAGSLAEFVGDNEADYADVPVKVYPSTLDQGDRP